MKHEVNPGRRQADERARAMIALIDDLIFVVSDENVELAKGMPASRLKQIDEKTRLAELFEQRVAECAERSIGLHVQDRVLRERLLERILALRAAMDENVLRLRAAIEATNRRIDAVMQAVREQVSRSSPYGAGGRIAAARSVSCGTNVRI